ncbi:MAG: DNA adenine methylase, partial [Ruminococcus sp.]|nr:DNA adenine methylase [Ruminococcus sp.]
MGGNITTGCEPPIPWIGGKTVLLPVIKRIIPERKNKFLDVFGGGGSVSLSGKYAPLQIYNDYNPHLANFMRIIKSRSDELIDKLTGAYNSDGTFNEDFERAFFINSRDSFNACSNVFHKGDSWEKLFDANLKIQIKAASLAEKEHAWSIVLDAWRLYKERENDPELIDAVLFFYLMKCSYSATGTSWACKAVNRESMVRLINEASRMMQGITVENKDCIELIKLHDDPSTFV